MIRFKKISILAWGAVMVFGCLSMVNVKGSSGTDTLAVFKCPLSCAGCNCGMIEIQGQKKCQATCIITSNVVTRIYHVILKLILNLVKIIAISNTHQLVNVKVLQSLSALNLLN